MPALDSPAGSSHVLFPLPGILFHALKTGSHSLILHVSAQISLPLPQETFLILPDKVSSTGAAACLTFNDFSPKLPARPVCHGGRPTNSIKAGPFSVHCDSFMPSSAASRGSINTSCLHEHRTPSSLAFSDIQELVMERRVLGKKI